MLGFSEFLLIVMFIEKSSWKLDLILLDDVFLEIYWSIYLVCVIFEGERISTLGERILIFITVRSLGFINQQLFFELLNRILMLRSSKMKYEILRCTQLCLAH
jgi:hypothetical protein